MNTFWHNNTIFTITLRLDQEYTHRAIERQGEGKRKREREGATQNYFERYGHIGRWQPFRKIRLLLNKQQTKH